MDTIHLRLDVRIEKDMYDFLQEEASLKKLSFEGLILLYIRERMERQLRNATGGSGYAEQLLDYAGDSGKEDPGRLRQGFSPAGP